MDIPGYSSHVLVNGRKVKEYRHNGLTFIEAKDGTEFAVEVKNHYSNRVLAIVSVDGLDIIDGKPATNKSRGYIITGNNAQTIFGWRKSDTEVGNFKFTTSDKSYATEKGKGQNNGIIAVKLIAEKPKMRIAYSPPQPVDWNPPVYPKPHNPWPRSPNYPEPYWGTGNYGGGTFMRGTSAAAPRQRVVYDSQALYVGPSADNVAIGNGTLQSYSCAVDDNVTLENASFDMGTTWGSKREDKVVETEFEYGQEIGTFEFYYASRQALQAMGVPLINERQIPALPKAFETKYAEPPKNWR